MKLEFAVASAFLTVLLTAACAGDPLPDPNVITIAVPSSPGDLDPRVGVDEASARVHQLLYDQLFETDENLRVAPSLATHWDMPDALTYVVHLRDGVRFHDGRELTSRDVVHTFKAFLDPEFVSARKGAFTLLDSVRGIDARTVEFKLKRPFGSFPVNLVMQIVPDGSGSELRDHPIGTGPYQFVSFAADDKVVLKANPHYYRGAPTNTGIVLKVVPDDIMRGLELRKGTVDIVINDLPPDVAYQLEQDKELQLVTSPGTDYMYLGLNLRDPALKDLRVRQAISYAIDRDAIVKYLRRGLARPAVGILPPRAWAFEPNVVSYQHDPARAKRLLDEAGFTDPDGDGPLPRLNLSLKVSTLEQYRLQATVIQQDLKQVGINLDVRSYEFATLFDDLFKGAFQMVSMQWVGITDPDVLRRVFHSSQVPPSGWNRGFYHNPEVDRLIDAATVSTDEAERHRLYAETQRLIAQDLPYISLWYKTNVAVAQVNLEGIHLTPATDFVFLRSVRRVPRPSG
ncbi:MAG TPA: ABC transporter substrate-binding protein [Vicinamibacterales bacterium]